MDAQLGGEINLPVDILRAAVLPFLSLRDILMLDNASCNTHVRPKFHEALRGYVHSNSTPVKFNSVVATWTTRRHCYLSKCTITHFAELSHLLSDVLLHCTDIELSLDSVRQPAGSDSTVVLRVILDCAPQLTSLDMYKCRNACMQSDGDIPFLPVGLKQLTLKEDELTDEAVHRIVSRCVHLESLRMHNSRLLTGAALRFIAQHCSTLQHLFLCGSRRIDWDVDIEHLARGCPALRSFSLYEGVGATDIAVVSLATNCPRLTAIMVSGAERLTDVSLRSLADNCAELTSFDLGYCLHMSTEAVVYLATRCRLLQAVKLPGALLRGEAMYTLAAHCSILKEVNLAYCVHLPSSAIQALAAGCPLLGTVHLQGCCLVDDAAVASLAQHCAHLEQLDLSSCTLVTDAALAELASYSHRLIELIMNYCDQITAAGLLQLAERCAALATLYIGNCRMVSAEDLDLVQAVRPGLLVR